MIYVVSGYMRSGTSMLMQCLEAGGMSVVASPQRDIVNRRHSDQHYRPNPRSLYEPTDSEIGKPGWPREHDGMAIKVLAPFVRHLAVHEYRAVFMLRDPEEIRQSYEAAFKGRVTCDQIAQCQQEAFGMLHNRRDVLSVSTMQYADVVADPLAALQELNWPVDAKKAASVVQPELYRFRRERLVEGL